MKKKNTTIILIISILVTLFVVFAFVFIFKIIQNKNEHTSKVLITLAEKIEDKKNAKILSKKFIELESIYQNINNYFVDPSKIDIFVDYLEKLGLSNQTDLIVKNVEILSKEKDTILVRVSIRGSFANVASVIYLLENIPFNVKLNQIFLNKETENIKNDVDGKEEGSTNSFWRADVSFNILSLPK